MKPIVSICVVPFNSDHPRHVLTNLIAGILMRPMRYSSKLSTFDQLRYFTMGLIFKIDFSNISVHNYHVDKYYSYVSPIISTCFEFPPPPPVELSSHAELLRRSSYSLFQNDESMTIPPEPLYRQRGVVRTSINQTRSKSILKLNLDTVLILNLVFIVQGCMFEIVKPIIFHAFQKQFATRLRRHLIFFIECV